MDEARGLSATLLRAVALGAALWAVTHALTHRLLAPAVAPVGHAGEYAGSLGPLVVATVGLAVLSTVAIVGPLLRAGPGPQRRASVPELSTVVAPAVFTALETLKHLDAHDGAPPVGLVLVGAGIHVGVVWIVRQLWTLVRATVEPLSRFGGPCPAAPSPAGTTCGAGADVVWTPADSWSGRAPPRAVRFPVLATSHELMPT